MLLLKTISLMALTSSMARAGTAYFHLAPDIKGESCCPSISQQGGTMSINVPPEGFIEELNMQFTIPNVNGGQSFLCYLGGQLSGDSADFTIQDGANFLVPCGPNNGLTLRCPDPVAACAG